MSQTEDNFQEANPQWFEKMLWKMAVLHLILYITIKGDDTKGCMKPTGGRLGRQGESKMGKHLELDKNK